ncbi:hypothetical protein J6590_001661 [Homalodisca vitripennis]|nr:hypothetical protein J6590_001661 [Homalodisca vitripennis]
MDREREREREREERGEGDAQRERTRLLEFGVHVCLMRSKKAIDEAAQNELFILFRHKMQQDYNIKCNVVEEVFLLSPQLHN